MLTFVSQLSSKTKPSELVFLSKYFDIWKSQVTNDTSEIDKSVTAFLKLLGHCFYYFK